jgi:hypothetical protein
MLCFIKKIDVLLKIDALPSLTRLRKEWDRVIGKTERLIENQLKIKKLNQNRLQSIEKIQTLLHITLLNVKMF